jgi:Bacterial CdiA-CT RNAse A domain
VESEGLEVVLSPLQLAAILENDSIDQGSCLSNRFWGAASVVGGAMELIGAAALFLAPEPTTVTKIAGGVLAVHGADTASAGLTQVVSCQTRTTLTSQAVTAAAKALGADPATASHVALAVEIAVPIAAGFVGAARAVAIRRGAVSLAAEETLGGHTIARHVGRTEAELRLRLAQQPAIPAASTFVTLQEAERVVGAALRSNKAGIKAWAAAASPGQTKAFTYISANVVGRGVVRSTGKLMDMTNVVVVVRKVVARNRVYFVLTAYPKP